MSIQSQLAEKDHLLAQQREQISELQQLLKLKMLQTRVNPHFLFNSLNAIQYYIHNDDKRSSLQYINRFSGFLRHVINRGDELQISLREEAEILQEYLWLESCRFPGRFDYSISLPDAQQEAAILPLLTLALVEEALYKCILNREEQKKGSIWVEFAAAGEMLQVKIVNNGADWMTAEELERKKGKDLVSDDVIGQRLRLYNSQTGKKISIRYDSAQVVNAETYNIVKLQLPQPLFGHSFL